MTGFLYQIKNIRRDKLCILTFLLPVIVGAALQLMSGMSFNSLAEMSFGTLRGNLASDTIKWLQNNGNVTVFESIEDLQEAVTEPSTQLIGVLADKENTIKTLLSGDELEMVTATANALPQMYKERGKVPLYKKTIIPAEQNHDFLQSLLIVITLVTAMFMGCTFNAMSIIGEKEEGIVFVNQVLPMKKPQYMLQKMTLGFLGGVFSALITAVICIHIDFNLLLPMLILIVLSSLIAAVAGLFIAHFSRGLMAGIVYIKIIMILFLAPPVVFYLYTSAGSPVRAVSCILPSGATFYGLMDLLNGQTEHLRFYVLALLTHCILWFSLYLCLSSSRSKRAGFRLRG